MGSLRDELMKIYNGRGVLNPDVVVEEADPVDHPLHNRFEWNDSVCGVKYRREQAHRLIQSVGLPVVYAPGSNKPTTVRAFQAVHTEQGHVYKPTEEVVQDPFLQRLVLSQMEREWKAMLARYENFSEFVAMVTADMQHRAS